VPAGGPDARGRSRPAAGAAWPQGTVPAIVVRTELAGRLDAPGRARAVTRDTLAAWGAAEHVDTVTLLVSELVTNAVLHADGPVELVLRRSGDVLTVEAVDRGSAVPRPRSPAWTEEGGRGLNLVGAIADRWGYRPTPDGKVVWLEVGVGPQADRGRPAGLAAADP
jgi:anti-sigma regulatory factor (Ser/Thr protein kinase)